MNLQTDRTNCGGCGVTCANTTQCLAGACVPYASCNDLHTAAPTLASGEYDVAPVTSGASVRVYCEMTLNDGGWTLVGSVLNGVARTWNSLAVFTDTSTFGTIASRLTGNFKSPAWSSVRGADLMVQTEDYSFGFRSLLGDRSFGTYIGATWPMVCAATWTRSGADFATGLSAQQQRAFNFGLRALDSNCSCFPGCNENVAIGFLAAECCWVNGLGNTPGGQASWLTHDLSLLRVGRISPTACVPGVYPCNANGLTINSSGECYEYDTSCKSRYALIYVR